MSDAPVCVVGAGVAGLCTALALAPRPVLLLSRGEDAMSCASALAQGGLAAAVGPGDGPREHARDTLIAGGGENDRDAVNWLTDAAAAGVAWLEANGVLFDRNGSGYALAREGGHRRARVLHCGGDATGHALVAALAHLAGQAPHITWINGADLDALGLAQSGVTAIRWRDRGRQRESASAAVVLAGGSLAGIFSDSTHPPDSDGSALYLALVAGAAARSLHYIQFHPTALYCVQGSEQRMPLITEALRGAGAVLRDAHGRRFMKSIHPQAELAPRDVCARAVWQAQQRSGWAWLHAEHLDIDWDKQFPTVMRTCLASGIDPRRDPLPVGVAAHYQVGGITCDLDGRTTIPRLSVVGEIASSGVHGANRLASNSLLEAVVAGIRLGRRLSTEQASAPAAPMRWVTRGPAASESERATLRQLAQRCLGPLREPGELRAALELLSPQQGLGSCWSGRLLSRVVVSALADPRSNGVHCWR